ncbi:MAG: 16S rRNA (adenine(1518)-N(6)/adenine(1519)-N(6))-dimethyltransferase RsmA [Bacteroidales bacterium]|nr:16S rRNA (adenine(1518)-N(6)/adenine(1519)-N(6))-dimethyltransferase RsmA [Bacteroidales bacterium]
MVQPKKHLGQHFLKDQNIANKIVSNLSPEIPNILEVGPGTGILTKQLINLNNINSFFLEIDKEAISHLKTEFPEIRDRLVHGDILKFDLRTIFSSPFAVIGNFPYNISTGILFRLLEYRDMIPEITGMFQQEVAERIVSDSGSKVYGILSVLIQTFYSARILFTISPNVFFPKPKVNSAVVKFERNERQLQDNEYKKYKGLVKAAFNQRRKMLKNALANYTFTEAVIQTNILSRRAEQLDITDFLSLSEQVEVKTKQEKS